ncbi:signal peptidase I [Rickettsiales bacterium]|nr:signal peptidase I [Rickettsiales bacterium]
MSNIENVSKDKALANKSGEWKETIKSVAIAIFIALIFRSFAFEPFYIPSGSMKSTLLVGDYVFVSKYKYGYSRYSLPFGLGLFDGRIMKESPKRGDVIVFKLPSDKSINYIKRLIGMPGDTIQVLNGVVYLNGNPIAKEQIEDFTDIDQYGNRKIIHQYIETLPNGVSYRVLDERSNGKLDNTGVYRVPEGHYFFMGDNRDNSQDSRVLSYVGYVPEDHLLGPANIIFFSTTARIYEFWKWFSGFRGQRFLSDVQISGDINE